MTREPLRRRLAEGLAEHYYVTEGQKFDEFKLADAALAALGLDDFDAAVERGSNEVARLGPRAAYEDVSRAVLEAALSTEGEG